MTLSYVVIIPRGDGFNSVFSKLILRNDIVRT